MLSSFLIKPIFLSIAPREAEIEAAERTFPIGDQMKLYIRQTNWLKQYMIYQSYTISHPIHVSFLVSFEKNVDEQKLFSPTKGSLD